MQIKQISVTGLFGIFDHVIPLNMDERITIIHSPNGFGKTTILKILNAFFKSNYSLINKIPFRRFEINLDRENIVILKEDEIVDSEDYKTHFYSDRMSVYLNNSDNEVVRFIPAIEPMDIDIVEDLIPNLNRIDSFSWEYLTTNTIIDIGDIIEQFSDILPVNFASKITKEPQWLISLKDGIEVHLMESQRLLNTQKKTESKHISISPTVSKYADEIAQIIQEKFMEYGTISQSIDRTFPTRLVAEQTSTPLNEGTLNEHLNEINETRSKLVGIGLLEEDDSSGLQDEISVMDESMKRILSIYIRDVKKKLSVFSEFSEKIDLFKKIINRKFRNSYKEIIFSKKHGFIFKSTFNYEDRDVSPHLLSSGEQHELILIYELLFKVKPNSLVLIDEPELSLHVGWQIEFLKDLQEIIKLANIEILIATHAPSIIEDRWDLTVELKRPE